MRSRAFPDRSRTTPKSVYLYVEAREHPVQGVSGWSRRTSPSFSAAADGGELVRRSRRRRRASLRLNGALRPRAPAKRSARAPAGPPAVFSPAPAPAPPTLRSSPAEGARSVRLFCPFRDEDLCRLPRAPLSWMDHRVGCPLAITCAGLITRTHSPGPTFAAEGAGRQGQFRFRTRDSLLALSGRKKADPRSHPWPSCRSPGH